MSEKKGQVVSLDELLQQAALLRDSIERLQVVLNEYASLAADYRAARDAIDAMSRGEGEVEFLAPLNSRRSVLGYSRLVRKDAFIIHVGGDVFVELPPEPAARLLVELEGEANKIVEQLNTELRRQVEQYSYIQALLAQVQQAALARQAQQRSGGKG